MSVVESLVLSHMSARSMPETNCFHCGLALATDACWQKNIGGASRSFCCPACQTVCAAIYEGGLEGFYERTPDDVSLTPPPNTPKDLALYDLDEVQGEFVSSLAKQREINLLVDGIHCAACVWLIERSLAGVAGITSAKVNLSGKRLCVAWDNDVIPLSKIIRHLSQVGYAAVPYDPEVAEGVIKKHNRALLLRMAFAGFAMMNLLWVSIALYSGADQGEFRSLFHWVGFALATPTLFYSGYPFLKGAVTGLKRGHLTMDLPIAIGASVTYVYSAYITIAQPDIGEVYFDTVVNFIFVILVGRYLESMSKRQAIASTQRLLDLQPKGATVVRDGVEKVVPIRSVAVGEIVLVKPGDKIPVDGVIRQGDSAVDEAMLSGESNAVRKIIGDSVSAGTINVESALLVEVQGTLKNTALGRIINLVEHAQQSKAPIQCLTDRIVPWFVFLTLTLATITYFIWADTGLAHALMAATAVLIITCPCALGLATPMSIAVASGLGARHGVLIKSGDVFENLSKINHVVFDKTGTLTEGRMHVKNTVCVEGVAENDLLCYAAALERFSEHNIATAIVNEAKQRELVVNKLDICEFKNKAGYGVSAVVDGQRVLLGSMAWMIKNGLIEVSSLQDHAHGWEKDGTSCVYVAMDQKIIGVIGVADKIRSDAKALLEKLHANGIKVTMLSGDRRPVAEAIAAELGGKMDIIAEVLPQDKDQVIAQLQLQGQRIVMVGDGINDAPALMRADVGIAIGSGTDVSIDSADVVLMSDELAKVWLSIELSKRTLKTIRQNMRISFTYNMIMVPVAMAALITPLVAALAMPVSSLAVIGNSSRIRTLFKNNREV